MMRLETAVQAVYKNKNKSTGRPLVWRAGSAAEAEGG